MPEPLSEENEEKLKQAQEKLEAMRTEFAELRQNSVDETPRDQIKKSLTEIIGIIQGIRKRKTLD